MAAPAAAASAPSPNPPPHTASTTAAALAGDSVPSLSTRSVWESEARVPVTPVYPPLRGALTPVFDVCVVGGGIAGVCTAYELGKAGCSVVVLEGSAGGVRGIGGATTGYSTAKLSAQQNLLYTILATQHGKETVKLYGEMNLKAIAKVEAQDRELGLNCSFHRAPHGTWTSTEAAVPLIRKEADLCIEAGLPAVFLSAEELLARLPKSIGAKAAVVFNDQASFNPITYCRGLADIVAKMPNCHVFESTRATEVSMDAPHTVTCENGSVKAKHVVLATHMPILDRSAHFAVVTPSRTSCISVRLSDPSALPKGMWISDPSTPMRSMRVTDGGELVVAGESYDQGKYETNQKYEALEKWTREHFPVAEVVHRWSTMDYVSSTHLPYIGYLHRGTTTLYTATGMSKWGLANGVAAGDIIRDLVLGGEAAFNAHPYTKMVDARRWDLVKAGPGTTKEIFHTVKHFVGDKIKAAFASDISKLRRGEGGLYKIHGEQVGAYLDNDGKYHLVKPVCTHLGCDVVFNQGEKCWDCPCHGSQFTIDGDVIQGPACKKLPSMNHLEW